MHSWADSRLLRLQADNGEREVKPAYRRPTDQERNKAKAMMRAEMRGLDDVDQRFREQFGSSCNLDHFEILPQIDVDFRAYIFLASDADLATCEADGTASRMQDFVREAISLIHRSSSKSVAFEMDSFENVRRNFNGNYFLRLRA